MNVFLSNQLKYNELIWEENDKSWTYYNIDCSISIADLGFRKIDVVLHFLFLSYFLSNLPHFESSCAVFIYFFPLSVFLLHFKYLFQLLSLSQYKKINCFCFSRSQNKAKDLCIQKVFTMKTMTYVTKIYFGTYCTVH